MSLHVRTRPAIGVVAVVCLVAHAPTARSQTIDFVSGAIANNPIVRDAPYSAESVTTVTQVLANGTRIERRTAAKVFRDSAGRVRREQALLGLTAFAASGESRTLITIADPVAGVSYVLDPSTRTGRRSLLPASASLGSGTQDRQSSSGGTQRPASGLGLLPPPPPPPRLPPPPPPPGAEIGLPPPTIRGRGTVENLGTRQIAGVRATGRRTRVSIPVGEIGNDRPMEILDERWESADLKVVVLSRHHDPRTGDVEYRLANIKREEPAADLFTVPSYYTIGERDREVPQ